jgi:hypothetical protein
MRALLRGGHVEQRVYSGLTAVMCDDVEQTGERNSSGGETRFSVSHVLAHTTVPSDATFPSPPGITLPWA